MSPSHVLEPTYLRLKRDLMAGAFPMGSKLEALRLAEELGVSMTPVRDSLNQLTGEGMVEFSPGDGYRVPRLTDQKLRDMLDVNHLLLIHALLVGDAARPLTVEEWPDTDDHATRLSAVFGRIAAGSGNRFVVRSILQIGERLNATRRLEPVVISSASETLRLIEDGSNRSRSECASALSVYHVSCLEAVPRLIAALPVSS